MTSADPALTDSTREILADLVDRLFPEHDGRPGAKDLGLIAVVAARLRSPGWQGRHTYAGGPYLPAPEAGFGWQSPLSPTESVLRVARAVDEWAVREHGQGFVGLDHDVQDGLVRALEDGSFAGLDDPAPRQAFELLLSLLHEARSLSGRRR